MVYERLTSKQLRFIEEYLKDKDEKAAALRAGYRNKNSGARLLRNAVITAKISELSASDEPEEELPVTKEDVLDGLLEEARYKDKGSTHAARVSAWTHIGKHLGMFNDKGKTDDEDKPMSVIIERKSKKASI